MSEIEFEPEVCMDCGCEIDPSEGYHTDDEGGVYCAECYEDRFAELEDE